MATDPNRPFTFPSDEMNAALTAVRRQARPVARRALRDAAEAITGEAQFEAPVKSGFLKDSHTVDASDPDTVRFGATAQYAAAVHETHPTKRRWFLRAILEEGPRILRGALAKALRDEGGTR